MGIKTIAETKYFPVFKAGTHTSADGVTRQYDEAFLDRVVAANAGRFSQVPFVLGHPETSSPKWGTLGGLVKAVVDGTPHLLAKGCDVVEQFADAVKARMYDQVSISVWPDGRLEHIGFLGAAAPAVEGLPRVEFAASAEKTERVTIQFASNQGVLRDIVGTLSRIRDYIIGREGIEAADKVVAPGMVQWLYTDIESLGASVASPVSYTQPVTGGQMDPLKKLQEQLETLTAQFEASKAEFAKERDTLKAEISTLTTTNSDLQTQVSAQQIAKRTAEFSAYADGLVVAGQLLPAQKDTVVGMLNAVADTGAYQFSKDVSKKPVDALKDLLASYPKQLLFSAVATGAGVAAPADNGNVEAIIERATAFQKAQSAKGIELNMTQAVLAVTQQAQ